jgi:uncharacterized membrane protein YphA (DoxX/SURF4 family)
MIRLPRIVVWILAIFIAAVFVLVGVSKLTGTSAIRWSERFARWGYPSGAAPAIGILEILGGVALLVPRSRRVGVFMLVALMLGALVTHVVHGEFVRVVPPVVLGGLALLVLGPRPAS